MDRKICHHDLHPDNILIKTDDEYEKIEIRLIDFNCAQFYDNED